MMKALYASQYGSTDDLEIREVPIPEPTDDQVLIKVQYATINDYDWSMVTGRPRIYRLIFGLRRPKNPVPGMEVAGII